MRAESITIAEVVAHDYFWPGMDYDDWRQEALEAAWKAELGFDARQGPYRPFCYLVVRRRLREVLRAASRKHQIPKTVTLLEADAAVLPDTTLEARELVAAVRRLSLLEQRAVVGVACGLSYGELRLVTGASHKSIDNAVQRARRQLRLAA